MKMVAGSFFIILLIILILGFGLNGWTLGALVLLFTGILSLIMTGVDIQKTKANWAEERCDVGVLLLGFLYKPFDDPRSSFDFAKENFNFCVSNAFQDILKTLLAPLTVVLGKSLDSADVLNDVMGGLRFLQAKMMMSFKKLLDPFWRRFLVTGLSFSRVFQRLYSSMLRAGGIAIATLYMAMGIQTSIENFVKFVIKVVIILIFIIAALFILLFFFLLPTLPLILTVMGALIAGGLGAALGSVGDTFCFAPHTKIKKEDGSSVKIQSLKAGDTLSDGARVEGVLDVEAFGEDIYSVDGILVSGSHLLWSEETQAWMSVRDFPHKSPARHMNRVFCLRTSSRNILIEGASGKTWKFRDWEELPADLPHVDATWDTIVSAILNKEGVNAKVVPHEYPLLGPQCIVYKRDATDKICNERLEKVKIGDTIYSDKGFTRVTGVYKSEMKSADRDTISDGCWIRAVGETKWIHPSASVAHQALPETMSAYHLITESGNFWVLGSNYSGFVRDFTEVGVENLPLTYAYTAALLKKSLAKEE